MPTACRNGSRPARPTTGRSGWSPRSRAAPPLLIHGLTDSPYSMKATAESLHARGIAVTVLRLPGHGTLPSMMTEMSYRDWKPRRASQSCGCGDACAGWHAVLHWRLLHRRNAGACCMRSKPSTIQLLRRPDRVLLISPAIELTRVAALANIIDIASIVPMPVLEKVRWQELVAEFDPYKFNSFPVNASRQVNRATRELQRALAGPATAAAIAAMPPVTAWQSVVDSTVGSSGTVDVLFAALAGPQHRLVLFDVNRSEAFSSVQRPAARALIERTVRGPRSYTLDLVTNPTDSEDPVVVHRLAPDGTMSGAGDRAALAARPRLGRPRGAALSAGRSGVRLHSRQWPRRHPAASDRGCCAENRARDDIAGIADAPAQQSILVADRRAVGELVDADLARRP